MKTPLKSLSLFLLCLAALSFSGCLKSGSESTCNLDPCSFSAPATEVQQLRDYLTTNNIQATQHCSGIFYGIEQPGSGKTPDACGSVDVSYEGRLTDGTVFDSTTTPVSFYLPHLITSWRIGIPLIKAGGVLHLYVPPSLGYGNYPVGNIPPNSILIFKINLVNVY